MDDISVSNRPFSGEMGIEVTDYHSKNDRSRSLYKVEIKRLSLWTV